MALIKTDSSLGNLCRFTDEEMNQLYYPGKLKKVRDKSPSIELSVL